MSYIEYSIIGLIIITLILVIFLFIKLYLKIKSTDKNSINMIEFPKETKERINSFINHIDKHNKELKDFLINDHNSAKKIITDIDEKIAPFEKVAREKNDELKEYKKGYEYSRNKALLDGIIETIVFIENAENKIHSNDEIAKSYFQSTKDKLLIVLNNSGIETFTPELNIQSLDYQGCEVDINTEPTNDKNKNNLIHSIVSNGYKLTLKDSDIHYIKKALVKVYEYKNVNIESEKKKL
jgi:flagellar motility protein MotE (MotC chaperone)|tara:strand:- start:232 stop:948 length:717 start_codon:yes stop_codon:yes gene_type:complete